MILTCVMTALCWWTISTWCIVICKNGIECFGDKKKNPLISFPISWRVIAWQDTRGHKKEMKPQKRWEELESTDDTRKQTEHEWMNKTKTTRDKERDANHQIKRGNTQNTSEGKKKKRYRQSWNDRRKLESLNETKTKTGTECDTVHGSKKHTRTN